jgi:cell division septal protein FtsQ
MRGDRARSRAAEQGGRFAVRRQEGPGNRTRMLVRIALIILGAVLCGVAYWLLSSHTFAVTRVESGSYRYTSEAELQGALGGLLGRNIWTVDQEEVSAHLVGLPWLRDLEIRRRLPATLRVDFREWEPILEVVQPGVVADGQTLVLREDGRIVPFPQHLPPAGLLVLTGSTPVREGEQGGWELEPGVLAEILELVTAMEDAGLETVCPVDFVVARAEGYAIVLQDRQGTLLVGREEFTDRLKRYVTARDRIESGVEVDLRFTDRITARPASE